MKMSKVFIPQEPLRKTDSGAMVPLYDLSPALEYGALEVLLPSGPVMLSTKPMVDFMKTKMDGFSDDDYVLAVGDPVAILAAGMVASHANNGRVKILRYDRQHRAYTVVPINIFNN